MHFFENHPLTCTVFDIPWQTRQVVKPSASYECHAYPLSIPGIERTHLWLVDVSKIDAVDFEKVLSSDEKKKLDGLLNLEQRMQRKLARVVLRQVLAHYLKTTPLAIEFDYNEAGKPMLGGKYKSKLSFNLSHAKEKVTILVSSGLAVGVDIEYDNPSEKVMLSIAKRFFSANEYELVFQAIGTERPKTFNRLWTMKEAMIKAKGLSVYGLLETPDLSAFNKRSAVNNIEHFQLPECLGFNWRDDQFHLTAVLNLS